MTFNDSMRMHWKRNSYMISAYLPWDYAAWDLRFVLFRFMHIGKRAKQKVLSSYSELSRGGAVRFGRPRIESSTKCFPTITQVTRRLRWWKFRWPTERQNSPLDFFFAVGSQHTVSNRRWMVPLKTTPIQYCFTMVRVTGSIPWHLIQLRALG